MTVLALKNYAGAMVSANYTALYPVKCGHVVWKDLPTHEIPITSVTNGIHSRS